nr:2-phospho-L-lactate guanylyltransferase [Prauserella halophila]
MTVTLLVPMKPPHVGKSRLRGVLTSPGAPTRPDSGGSPAAGEHTSLVLALALDTVSAALDTPGIDRVVVVTRDVHALAPLAELGADVVDDRGAPDLNTALHTAERLVRGGVPDRRPGPGRESDTVVGALQADLPALRSTELAAALAEAGGGRAFAADRHGTGTTLLLSAPGRPLAPSFGPGSAGVHARSGAVAVTAAVPSLRSDVDTPSDLHHTRALGLGPATTALLRRTGAAPAAARRPEG